MYILRILTAVAVFLLMACIGHTEGRAQVLQAPESVTYDVSAERYLISNINSGQIIQRHKSGVLSYFVQTGLTSPKGMTIIGDTLFVSDVTKICGYRLSTGERIMSVSIEGAQNLNDLEHDTSGNLYVSDMTANKIFKFDLHAQKQYTLVSSGLSSPNGLLFDTQENRLLVCSFIPKSPILAINTSSGEVTTITTTTLGYLDGITSDGAGNIYVSSWGANAVFRFAADFMLPPERVVSDLNGPADIFYNITTNTLAIPQMNRNEVTFVEFPTSVADDINKDNIQIMLYPNPCTDVVTICSPTVITRVELTDASGNSGEIHVGNSTSLTVPVAYLPDGMYYLTVHISGGSVTMPLQLQHF